MSAKLLKCFKNNVGVSRNSWQEQDNGFQTRRKKKLVRPFWFFLASTRCFSFFPYAEIFSPAEMTLAFTERTCLRLFGRLPRDAAEATEFKNRMASSLTELCMLERPYCPHGHSVMGDSEVFVVRERKSGNEYAADEKQKWTFACAMSRESAKQLSPCFCSETEWEEVVDLCKSFTRELDTIFGH